MGCCHSGRCSHTTGGFYALGGLHLFCHSFSGMPSALGGDFWDSSAPGISYAVSALTSGFCHSFPRALGPLGWELPSNKFSRFRLLGWEDFLDASFVLPSRSTTLHCTLTCLPCPASASLGPLLLFACLDLFMPAPMGSLHWDEFSGTWDLRHALRLLDSHCTHPHSVPGAWITLRNSREEVLTSVLGPRFWGWRFCYKLMHDCDKTATQVHDLPVTVWGLLSVDTTPLN